MLSIEKCREALGKEAGDMSDEHVIEARDEPYELSEIGIDYYLKKQSDKLKN